MTKLDAGEKELLVEAFRVRIADHVQVARDLGTVIDERPSHTALPESQALGVQRPADHYFVGIAHVTLRLWQQDDDRAVHDEARCTERRASGTSEHAMTR
jgi:hypothetical protein